MMCAANFVIYFFLSLVLAVAIQAAVAQQPPAQQKKATQKGKGKQAAYQLTAEEKQLLQTKLDELKDLVRQLKAGVPRRTTG